MSAAEAKKFNLGRPGPILMESECNFFYKFYNKTNRAFIPEEWGNA